MPACPLAHLPTNHPPSVQYGYGKPSVCACPSNLSSVGAEPAFAEGRGRLSLASGEHRHQLRRPWCRVLPAIDLSLRLQPGERARRVAGAARAPPDGRPQHRGHAQPRWPGANPLGGSAANLMCACVRGDRLVVALDPFSVGHGHRGARRRLAAHLPKGCTGMVTLHVTDQSRAVG